ncbi:MAG: hypothetical protein ACJAYU_005411, partial [Bradymonadia bacterium]
MAAFRKQQWPLAALIVIVACGTDDPGPIEDVGVTDTEPADVSDTTPDVAEDTVPDTVEETTPDVGEDADAEPDVEVDADVAPDAVDVEPDVEPVESLEFSLNWPIFEVPADPLDGVEACAVYEEE